MAYTIGEHGAKNYWHERTDPRKGDLVANPGLKRRFSFIASGKEGAERRIHPAPSKHPRDAALTARLSGIGGAP